MARAAPEAALQKSVRDYLTWCLDDAVEWKADLAGIFMSQKTREKAKAQGGLRRGWPDLQFLFPDGVTRYIELKAGASLSPEQRAFRDRCAPHGIFAVCRSLEEVERTLRGWGAPLRAHPFRPPAPA